MSMLDSFFNKGFKGSKCKTLLKLTIPRIKLLRNRRELQIKQMRKDIAKLLETGQEATARIRVEHIVREENMMAAQEIIELYCELIAVRLPIIESQRECPLDLKEAISSICFAAPRCADLPELLQVQMAFASKYGREFVAAATELMPDCGVNRQIVELLSVRAPSAEKKLKLLKEIAEEHDLEWDPAPSETELFKSHEDLLNGPTQFVSGSKVPLPKEKHDETLQSTSVQGANDHSDSEESIDQLDFPEVPKVPLRPTADSEVAPPQSSAPHLDPYDASETHIESKSSFQQSAIDPEDILQLPKHESSDPLTNSGEPKQFVPFISPPSFSSASLPLRETNQSPPHLKTKSDSGLDLHDVLAAAKAAAESAERAAAAARSAASLAEVRISELSKSKSGIQSSNGNSAENPFQHNLSALGDNDGSDPWSSGERIEDNPSYDGSKHAANDETEVESKSSPLGEHASKQELPYHQPQRIPSMDDDSYFSYPNLFSSQTGNVASESLPPDSSQRRHGS